jgi:hypothetical protein
MAEVAMAAAETVAAARAAGEMVVVVMARAIVI